VTQDAVRCEKMNDGQGVITGYDLIESFPIAHVALLIPLALLRGGGLKNGDIF